MKTTDSLETVPYLGPKRDLPHKQACKLFCESKWIVTNHFQVQTKYWHMCGTSLTIYFVLLFRSVLAKWHVCGTLFYTTNHSFYFHFLGQFCRSDMHCTSVARCPIRVSFWISILDDIRFKQGVMRLWWCISNKGKEIFCVLVV